MSQAIHKALNKAMEEICRLGIAKASENKAQGFSFRGIEAAMNELSPIMVRNGITVSPKYSELTIQERIKGAPADGKATRFATIKGSFTFTSMEDGSNVLSEAYGEAMDSGDKAVTKAQSVSFRTALFQVFVVPTMSMDPESDEYKKPDAEEGLDAAQDAAMGGTDALKTWWAKQPASLRTKLGAHLPSLKQAATEADKAMK